MVGFVLICLLYFARLGVVGLLCCGLRRAWFWCVLGFSGFVLLAGFGFWLMCFWVGCCVRLAGFALCLLVCWVIWVCCCCSLLVLGGLGGGCSWFGLRGLPVVDGFPCLGFGFDVGACCGFWVVLCGLVVLFVLRSICGFSDL